MVLGGGVSGTSSVCWVYGESYSWRQQEVIDSAQAHGYVIVGTRAELEQAVAILEDIGFPFRFSDYRFDPVRALVPIRYVRFLRNRYSSFNLMHEVGVEQKVLGLLDQRIEMIR